MFQRMKKHPRKAMVLLVVVLVVTLLAGILWPSGSGIVHAESISLTYNTDSYWDGYAYSKYPTLTPTNTVAKAGYKIKSLKVVNYVNNQVVQTISAAEGQTSYTLSGNLSGIRTKVASVRNETTKGYYAWYRYAKGTNGNNWHANFARVDDSYNEYGDSRTSQSSSLDSYGMPEHPGTTDTNLSLTGGRDKPFYTEGGQWVDTPYISHDELTGSATVNADNDIDGPPGEGISGKAKPATISLNKVDAFPDLNRIIVRYAQDFNYVEDNFKPLAAYGAALMVYFSAFTVDLESYTYQYPYKLDVEWEALSSPTPSGGTVSPTPTPTSAPTTDDLEVVSLNFSPATFTPRDDVSFTYVFRNNSPKSWSYFYYSVGSSEYLFTGTLAPGGTYSSSLTRKIDSPFTLTVKIDSRNLIPESNESNNEKTVTAIPSSVTDNQPPEGRLKWFYVGTDKVADTVPEGTRVDLKYVDVSDPDGDAVSYRMNFNDFTSQWLKTTMINKFGSSGDGYDAFQNIDTTGGAGYHVAKGRLVDAYGGYTDLSAGLTVIPPDPIAVINVGGWLKEYRRIRVDANQSYSPIGRAIDHSRTTWTITPVAGETEATLGDIEYLGTLTGAIKDFRTLYKGKYRLRLTVYDTAGLSNTTEKTIDVLPDLPPIATVINPVLGIRNESYDIVDGAYSPDDDLIGRRLFSITYDANNDGAFDEDPFTFDLVPMEIGESLSFQTGDGETITVKKTEENIFEFKSKKVGRFNFGLEVKETPGQPTNLEY